MQNYPKKSSREIFAEGDWLNINESLNTNYKRDNNTFYKDFILKEWEEYKFNFFKILKQKANKNVPINTSIEKTHEMIKEKQPLILGANLIYEDMIVYCDIIIDINLFVLIFPKIKNYPLHLINVYDLLVPLFSHN